MTHQPETLKAGQALGLITCILSIACALTLLATISIR